MRHVVKFGVLTALLLRYDQSKRSKSKVYFKLSLAFFLSDWILLRYGWRVLTPETRLAIVYSIFNLVQIALLLLLALVKGELRAMLFYRGVEADCEQKATSDMGITVTTDSTKSASMKMKSTPQRSAASDIAEQAPTAKEEVTVSIDSTESETTMMISVPQRSDAPDNVL